MASSRFTKWLSGERFDQFQLVKSSDGDSPDGSVTVNETAAVHIEDQNNLPLDQSSSSPDQIPNHQRSMRWIDYIKPAFLCDSKQDRSNDVIVQTSSYFAVTAIGSILLLLVVYNVNSFSLSANREFRASHVRNFVGFVQKSIFNCTDLGLKGEKLISNKHHYHTFPADVKSNGINVCQSKYQQACFRKNTEGDYLPPPKFTSALRKYEEYHERCTKGLDITHLGKTGEAPEGCKYLVWKAMDGMGNQLLSLVCAFVYSLLTKRVMLIATDSHIERVLCNPFPSSSWTLPDNFPEPHLRTSAKRVSTYLDETLRKVQANATSSCNTISPSELPSYISEAPRQLQAYIICCDGRRDHQFFCPTAQKLFSGVNWIFYHSHEYTLPGFYFIPEFRQQLNDWFPNRDVFMHASRYLLNPQNNLWERISDIYRTHMDGVPKHFGLQVRSWKGDYDPSISRQILRCAVDQQLLPKPLDNQQQTGSNKTMDTHVPDISVLVASLRSEYSNNLRAEYVKHPNQNGSNVNVFTASSEGRQRTGDPNHDETAITDIWLLSFTQELVTTPFSTFGSTASGLAGITPLLFNNYGQDKVNEAACGRTNAGGPCMIVYPRNQPCDLDPPRASIFDPAEKVPEVKMCSFNPGLGIESIH